MFGVRLSGWEDAGLGVAETPSTVTSPSMAWRPLATPETILRRDLSKLRFTLRRKYLPTKRVETLCPAKTIMTAAHCGTRCQVDSEAAAKAKVAVITSSHSGRRMLAFRMAESSGMRLFNRVETSWLFKAAWRRASTSLRRQILDGRTAWSTYNPRPINATHVEGRAEQISTIVASGSTTSELAAPPRS